MPVQADFPSCPAPARGALRVAAGVVRRRLLSRLPNPRSCRALRSSLLLDVARAGDRLVAVGERGHVLYSDDSGRTLDAGAGAGVGVAHGGVVRSTRSSGWAVGTTA